MIIIVGFAIAKMDLSIVPIEEISIQYIEAKLTKTVVLDHEM